MYVDAKQQGIIAQAPYLIIQDNQALTDLWQAAKKTGPDGFLEFLKGCSELDRMQILNKTDENGLTLLQQAASNVTNLKVSDVLDLYPTPVERMEALNKPDIHGNTLLHLAARYNSSVLSYLLNEHPPEKQLNALKQTNNTGETVLHNAVSNAESLTIVLNRYPTKEERLTAIEHVNKVENNAVIIAAQYGPATMSIILNEYSNDDARINAVEKINDDFSPLCIAARNDSDTLAMMLNMYSDEERCFKAVNRSGSYSALNEAIYKARVNGEFDALNVIFNKLPLTIQDNQLMDLVTRRRMHGESLLSTAIQDPSLLKKIIDKFSPLMLKKALDTAVSNHNSLLDFAEIYYPVSFALLMDKLSPKTVANQILPGLTYSKDATSIVTPAEPAVSQELETNKACFIRLKNAVSDIKEPIILEEAKSERTSPVAPKK